MGVPGHSWVLTPSAVTDGLVEGAIEAGTVTALICLTGCCSLFRLPERISLWTGFSRRWRRRIKSVMAAADQGQDEGTFVVLTLCSHLVMDGQAQSRKWFGVPCFRPSRTVGDAIAAGPSR